VHDVPEALPHGLSASRIAAQGEGARPRQPIAQPDRDRPRQPVLSPERWPQTRLLPPCEPRLLGLRAGEVRNRTTAPFPADVIVTGQVIHLEQRRRVDKLYFRNDTLSESGWRSLMLTAMPGTGAAKERANGRTMSMAAQLGP
jgi:hypothetical protein